MTDLRMTNYRYRYLPSGNTREFPRIDEELKRRDVRAEISEVLSGGRMYRFAESELPKLPQDELGPYLGDDRSGYSLHEGPAWEQYRQEWNGSDWKALE